MSVSKIPMAPGALVLAAAVVAAYANTFSVPLLLDDLVTIALNPSIRHLWPLGPVLDPPALYYTAGRPLYNLSYALNYAVGGAAVGGYHAVNLAIHLAAALALFGVVRRTLELPRLREKFGADAPMLAFFVALLWALHPVQTEAVTYLSQRSELLMGLCYLTTLYCFVRGAAAERGKIWFGVAVLSCALGMASKEVMVTAPAMVLLFDRFFLSDSFREAWRQRGRVHAALMATWLLLAWLMIATDITKRDVGTDGHLVWGTYVLTEFHVVVDYLKLTLWPHPLVFYYGPELYRVADNVAATLACAGVIAALLGASLAGAWRGKAWGFLGLAFFLLLAPTSSVVPLAQQPMAESRLYLPVAAVVTLLALTGYARAQRKFFPVLGVAALVLGAMAFARNSDYRSEISIWSDTVEKQPANARAHALLAGALGTAPGREADAIAHLETAVRLDPTRAEAHNNLANLLARAPERRAEAIRHYEDALRLRPNFADAHTGLGIALAATPGREADALAHFETAARLQPDSPDAKERLAKMHAALADTLAGIRGREAGALAHYEAALRVKPDLVVARYNLAVLHARTGKLDAAIVELETVLKQAPDFAAARSALKKIQEKAP